MGYPSFEVPGVKPEDVWQLFNVSNYKYYKQKVKDLIAGVCPFCQIDPDVNRVILENDCWRMWVNEMAPRSGQKRQFIFPLKRHVEDVGKLTGYEWSLLGNIVRETQSRFGVTGGVIVIRTGDPSKNAKSVPHLHVNLQEPTGIDRVEVTIAKSQADLDKKLPVLLVFEKMRLLEESGETDPFSKLESEEQQLVAEKLGPLATTAK